MGKVFMMKAQGPEFKSQKIQAWCWVLVTTGLGRQKQENPWTLLASLPSYNGEFCNQ